MDYFNKYYNIGKKYNNNLNKIEKSYVIHTDTSRMSRIVGRKGDSILPKHGDVHKSTKWLNELRDRYCFLYKNAPLIIAFMVDYLPNSFNEEVYRRTNFKFKESSSVLHTNYLSEFRNLTILEILEDYMLGYDTTTYNDLVKLVAYFEKHPDEKIKKAQEEFDFSKGNVGIGKFDQCMKILLDTVYTFVEAQQSFKVLEARKTKNGYYEIKDYAGNKNYIYSGEISLKFDTLTRYYSILGYRHNQYYDSVFLDKGIDGLSFSFSGSVDTVPIRLSLVGRNNFLEAFGYYPYRASIMFPYSYKSDIYERVHDEIPYNHNAICSNIHGVENSCGAEFFPKEEDIFYLDGEFKTLCPCCGSLVTTSVMNRYHKNQIEERIKKRSLEDQDLKRKITLLSELIGLDGTDYNKDKVMIRN